MLNSPSSSRNQKCAWRKQRKSSTRNGQNGRHNVRRKKSRTVKGMIDRAPVVGTNSAGEIGMVATGRNEGEEEGDTAAVVIDQSARQASMIIYL